MKQEIRNRWTAALRSGQYEQGRGQLQDMRGRFCCLGVLCDVTGQPTSEQGIDNYMFLRGLIPKREVDTLWIMNDSHGKSFAEIADWIERNIEVTP